MDKLLIYLNSLPKAARQAFVARCNTSEGYLRKAASKGQRIGERLCIAIDRESGGVVRCEDIRPEVDWAYLRRTACPGSLTSQDKLSGHLDCDRDSAARLGGVHE
ncbi:Cro/Cl family transcriptional regulator [Delftia sp. CH05]|nr:YdaS family helix-turn-helix protein [Delftia sp. CH05]MXN29993.1 Cro/Cl family transcriptional regulator [Delftia sp. CH05]